MEEALFAPRPEDTPGQALMRRNPVLTCKVFFLLFFLAIAVLAAKAFFRSHKETLSLYGTVFVVGVVGASALAAADPCDLLRGWVCVDKLALLPCVAYASLCWLVSRPCCF